MSFLSTLLSEFQLKSFCNRIFNLIKLSHYTTKHNFTKLGNHTSTHKIEQPNFFKTCFRFSKFPRGFKITRYGFRFSRMQSLSFKQKKLKDIAKLL